MVINILWQAKKGGGGGKIRTQDIFFIILAAPLYSRLLRPTLPHNVLFESAAVKNTWDVEKSLSYHLFCYTFPYFPHHQSFNHFIECIYFSSSLLSVFFFQQKMWK